MERTSKASKLGIFVKDSRLRKGSHKPTIHKGNRQYEVTNEIIVNILCKKIKKNHRDWYSQLIYALWEYIISIGSAIWFTFFSLVYEDEIVLPLEVEIPSL